MRTEVQLLRSLCCSCHKANAQRTTGEASSVTFQTDRPAHRSGRCIDDRPLFPSRPRAQSLSASGAAPCAHLCALCAPSTSSRPHANPSAKTDRGRFEQRGKARRA